MGDHKFTKDAGAALVFLVLYGILFVWMISGYITKRYKWRSRWSLLFFHVTVRVASQALGVAFGVLGFDNIDIFIAYLILGAEGYFTLTIAAYLFLKSWQRHNWGDSWLASSNHDDGQTSAQRWISSLALLPLFAPWRYKHHVLAPIHALLIPANAVIITSGSMIAGTAGTDRANNQTAKILRSIGSAIFLLVTLFYNVCVLKTYLTQRRDRKGASAHPTLVILSIVGLFLIVRGTFGLLQAAVWSLSYTNPANYNSNGFTSKFILEEYFCVVTTEFCSAFLMNCTYWTAKGDKYPTSADIPEDLDYLSKEHVSKEQSRDERV